VSRWTHTICDPCYRHVEPGRVPHRMIGAPLEPCCYCGTNTDDGIFYRDDPETPRYCNGGRAHDDG
jgi:hypothetical protein